ncbi:MAG: hypothetical protein DHS20C18_01070 [Saprospiraceae bacterium]|nr:MAG: hypothetical protein DHS20C18_01070 [Saprospiraceae bacterium]
MMKQGKGRAALSSQPETKKFRLLAFGIARDIVGGNEVDIELTDAYSVGALKTALQENYPDFKRLKSLAIAVNETYRTDEHILNTNDEIVIIPPVSGG